MNANLPSGFPWTREEVPPPVIANYYAVVRQWQGGPTEEEQVTARLLTMVQSVGAKLHICASHDCDCISNPPGARDTSKESNRSRCRLGEAIMKRGSVRRAVKEKMEQYAQDPEAAILQLAEQEGCPQLPHDLWLKIISKEYVDLERDVCNARTITSPDDWMSAWKPYAAGLRIAFPCLQRELQVYEDYVANALQTLPLTKVLKCDIRCRKAFAAHNDRLLTEYRHIFVWPQLSGKNTSILPK